MASRLTFFSFISYMGHQWRWHIMTQAYKKVGVHSHLKQHLAQHMLGYKQEQMGVDKNETSKLSWLRDTYGNVYTSAFPKQAILGAHGHKAHEEYHPLWQEVPVSNTFISVFCPTAKSYLVLPSFGKWSSSCGLYFSNHVSDISRITTLSLACTLKARRPDMDEN
ncbi:hypothetical protein BDN71DRAFT_1436531 [Pleurotus eryngii]|uniref:Uncharacterized protein n=1 Tax=Pleurotus eryngii TaxID=5323 RepID=A0A9P5ZGL8_PLEER|nr:hypothetical protein BDN71DRAFT_1436531 [Pleurotus eryngii]